MLLNYTRRISAQLAPREERSPFRRVSRHSGKKLIKRPRAGEYTRGLRGIGFAMMTGQRGDGGKWRALEGRLIRARL